MVSVSGMVRCTRRARSGAQSPFPLSRAVVQGPSRVPCLGFRHVHGPKGSLGSAVSALALGRVNEDQSPWDENCALAEVLPIRGCILPSCGRRPRCVRLRKCGVGLAMIGVSSWEDASGRGYLVWQGRCVLVVVVVLCEQHGTRDWEEGPDVRSEVPGRGETDPGYNTPVSRDLSSADVRTLRDNAAAGITSAMQPRGACRAGLSGRRSTRRGRSLMFPCLPTTPLWRSLRRDTAPGIRHACAGTRPKVDCRSRRPPSGPRSRATRVGRGSAPHIPRCGCAFCLRRRMVSYVSFRTSLSSSEMASLRAIQASKFAGGSARAPSSIMLLRTSSKSPGSAAIAAGKLRLLPRGVGASVREGGRDEDPRVPAFANMSGCSPSSPGWTRFHCSASPR